ncbi:MAG TPA: PKD domain-containing protein [Vicinamibacterales bacterium]|nr:PKD domain-containing protein [Vicinamibacterales bacterium]
MVRKLNVLVVAVAALAWFAASQPEYVAAQQPPGLARAIEAQERHTPGLLNVPGIVGTGVGVNAQGVPVIRVYVETPGVGAPPVLDNIPVERVVTGRIVAHCYQSECPRPVPLGVSTGHPDITAGTIGARVRDGAGNVYALSNNHVYANQNNASLGDSALQPGPVDGGSETDPNHKIGELAGFKPINFSGGNNDIDAAIASSTTAMLQNVTFSGYKPTSTLVEASVGLNVKKEGRTTGVTIGQISEVNVRVVVCYAGFPFCTKSATFVNQFAVAGSFSAAGDSGSLIVTSAGNDPVGLLFAGSSNRTIGNRIQAVLDYFGVAIDDSTGSPPPGNDPPTAAFTYSCTELACTFDASDSSDDGSIVSYAWNFGDGATGSGAQPSHTYAAGGTYTVVLTVTDNDAATDTDTQNVTVSSVPPSGIQLGATGYKVRGVHHADLTWSGATSSSVDIFRNGIKIITTANDGTHTDNIGSKGNASYTYRICEAGTTTCSNQVTINF